MIVAGGARDALAVAPARSESLVAPRPEIAADLGDPDALVVDVVAPPETDFGGIPLATSFGALRFMLIQPSGAYLSAPFPTHDLGLVDDLALVSALDAITAEVDALVAAAQAALAADIAATNLQVAQVTTDLNTAFADIAANGVQLVSLQSDIGLANASLRTEALARAAQGEAIAGQVTTAIAGVAAANASVTTEIVARASADSALAGQITAVNVSIGATNASVTAEIAARVSGDSALAVSITTLTSTVNGNTAAISAEAVTRASADSALSASITTNTASIAAVSASVTSETAARVAGDSALATSIAVTNTTVAGHTASIATIQSSVNGLAVQWAVKATLNGTSGHLEFNGLQLADGSGAVYVFDILANVNIHGTLVVDGTVVNNKLGSESATAVRGTSFSAVGSIATGTSTVVSWTFSTPIGGNTLVTSAGMLTPDTGVMSWTLKVDGTAVASGSVGSSNPESMSSATVVSIAAGSHTITIEVSNFGGSGASMSAGAITAFMGSR